jgi:hypothetical protein
MIVLDVMGFVHDNPLKAIVRPEKVSDFFVAFPVASNINVICRTAAVAARSSM